jgi:hypothetical protein
MNDSSTINITHRELCIATAKHFNQKTALYEYKSSVSREEPDVLVYGYEGTVLYEIKTSLSDFNADQKKECRKKFKVPFYLQIMERGLSPALSSHIINGNDKFKRQFLRIRMEHPFLFYQEDSHLGNKRYYVCPYGLIPPEKLPEGWGLYYFRRGKFYSQRRSNNFRSNLKTENYLLLHAMRRFASGDNTGILINTYGDIPGKVTGNA